MIKPKNPQHMQNIKNQHNKIQPQFVAPILLSVLDASYLKPTSLFHFILAFIQCCLALRYTDRRMITLCVVYIRNHVFKWKYGNENRHLLQHRLMGKGLADIFYAIRLTLSNSFDSSLIT